jgi:PAS domain S-box-containing protein
MLTNRHGRALQEAHRDLLQSNAELRDEVHARRQTEQALEQSNRRLDAIFQNAQDAIFLADDGGWWIDTNPSACRMLDYLREDLLGRNVRDLVTPSLTRSIADLWEELLRQGELRGEITLLTRTGRAIHVDYRAVANILPGMHLAILRDVSDRIRATQQIRQYNENLETLLDQHTRRIRELERQRSENERLAAQGRMAAQIAHEINNPLAGIKNAFRLVRTAVPDDHPHFPFVERIDDEIDRVTRIVQQMFGIYGKDKQPGQSFPLEELVLHVVGMLETTGLIKKIRLLVEIPENIRLELPKAQLIQVLFNLVQNAIDASEQGGEVEIYAHDQSESILLAVRDEGGGIPEEIQNQLFDPFFSTKTPASPRQGGMGLGLSISRNIVCDMNGEIRFQSRPGAGTVFEVLLPKRLDQRKDLYESPAAHSHRR